MLLLILICFLTILITVIGTMAGFGRSTLLIPLLSLFYPLEEALLMVSILHLLGNIGILVFNYNNINISLMLYFGIPGAIMSFLGALLVAFQTNSLLPWLGVTLVIYGLLILMKPSFKLQPTKSVAFWGGAMSGFEGGLFGLQGAVRTMFLSMFNLEPKVYVATAAAISMFIDFTRIPTYALNQGNVFTWNFIGQLVLLGFCTQIGVFITSYLAKQISKEYLRIFIALFLIGIGSYYILKAIL